MAMDGTARNQNGVAIILVVGVLAVFIIFFFVLAIDFARIYVVRGEMQNAADASVLAATALLVPEADNNPSAYEQAEARLAAWKFACENFADTENVFVEVAGTPDCDPSGLSVTGDLNGATNAADGDIVVGHWDGSTFTPADGNTGLMINAVKVVTRRTESSPGGVVALLFGGMIDRETMSVSQVAIAAQLPPRLVPLPICLPTCDLQTPLDGRWGYDKNEPEPILCTDEPSGPSDPPGQQLFLSASSQAESVPQPGLAWTNFAIDDCLDKSCDMPNRNEVEPYLRGDKIPPPICNKEICTTNGTIHPLLKVLEDEFNENKKLVTIDGENVEGWRVFVPVVANDSCGEAKQSCPGAQAGAANPYLVSGIADVLVTEVITSGKQGIRILGLQTPAVTNTYTIDCMQGQTVITKVFTRKITSISGGPCKDCDLPLPTEGGTGAKLVK